jgi:flavin-dependent dehydrogenase
MRSLECNVLVVGAGPAGSCAAREAAAAGANVLVLERRPVIGVPVQCAEYIPAPLVGEVGVGRGYIVQYVAGMRTMLNGEPIQELAAPGCMIRRDQFDQALAQAAREVGARYLLDTSAIAFDGRVLTARHRGGEIITIQADVMIGADGPHSRVGRWIGSANANCVPAAQMRVRLTNPLQYTEVFFDDRIYGGYAWLFPRGTRPTWGLACCGVTRARPNWGRCCTRCSRSWPTRDASSARPWARPAAGFRPRPRAPLSATGSSWPGTRPAIPIP